MEAVEQTNISTQAKQIGNQTYSGKNPAANKMATQNDIGANTMGW